MGTAEVDYDGVLVVVETPTGLVMTLPGMGTPDAPASLPGGSCEPGEPPRVAAVRLVRELTGLDVTLTDELTTFVQPGTPFGVMRAHGYVARVHGGSLRDDGDDGPAREFTPAGLPKIVGVRVANQRVLDEYLRRRADAEATSAG